MTPEPPDPAVDSAVEPPLEASPTTDTALPLTVTGAATATTAWFPDSTPSTPEVVTSAAGAGAVADDVVDASADSESPTTLTALPLIVTGAATDTTA